MQKLTFLCRVGVRYGMLRGSIPFIISAGWVNEDQTLKFHPIAVAFNVIDDLITDSAGLIPSFTGDEIQLVHLMQAIYYCLLYNEKGPFWTMCLPSTKFWTIKQTKKCLKLQFLFTSAIWSWLQKHISSDKTMTKSFGRSTNFVFHGLCNFRFLCFYSEEQSQGFHKVQNCYWEIYTKTVSKRWTQMPWHHSGFQTPHFEAFLLKLAKMHPTIVSLSLRHLFASLINLNADMCVNLSCYSFYLNYIAVYSETAKTTVHKHQKNENYKL